MPYSLLQEPSKPVVFIGGDEYDLLRNHIENRARWAETRDQLSKLIEYVKKEIQLTNN